MKLLSTALFLLIGTAASTANAGIVITGTRVVYPATDREVTVQFTNQATTPRLVQSWVDAGSPTETAETTRAPFLVTPAMVRVEGGQGQALRLMYTGTGANVPQDRESVFWLNVVEIPPRPKTDEEAQNYLQFAIRSRIKLFYRPKGLAGDPVSALDTLTWRLVRSEGGYGLECTNPSAFNVSFSEVGLKHQAAVANPSDKGGMCPAKGSQRFALDPAAADTARANGELTYTAIDDYGAFMQRSARFGE